MACQSRVFPKEHSSYWSDRSHKQEILENYPALEKVIPIFLLTAAIESTHFTWSTGRGGNFKEGHQPPYNLSLKAFFFSLSLLKVIKPEIQLWLNCA